MKVELSLVLPAVSPGATVLSAGPRFADLLGPPPPPRPVAPDQDMRLAEPRDAPAVSSSGDLRPPAFEYPHAPPQIIPPLTHMQFTELLEPASLAVERLDMAEAFQALGMFGRPPTVVGNADGLCSVQANAVPLPPGLKLSPPQSPVQHAVATRDRQQAVAGSIAMTAPARPVTVAVQTRPSSGVTQSLDNPCHLATADAEPELPSPGLARRPRTLPALNHAPQDQVSLLTLSADAAQVAVRAAGVSHAEVQQFRARVRDLFRDHGLSLDKLSVNGEDRTGSASPERKTQSWR